MADRLRPGRNPNHRDESFLNAVGAVWPYPVSKNGAGYPASTGDQASTGFLIDRCHVLTNLHVAYGDDDADVVSPPLGQPVAFGVGQTDSELDRGALQGLKFLLAGTVIARGNAIVLDGRVYHPEGDWALIRLVAGIDGAISPMRLAVVDPGRLTQGVALSSAGYPSDHRTSRGDGFRLKDLWTSDGRVVAAIQVNATGALLESTLQSTPGNSGGPVYGDFDGLHDVAIGIVQSVRGNGIDATESAPNVQLLFTPAMMTAIAAALSRSPCS